MKGFVTISISDQGNIENKCEDCVKNSDCSILDDLRGKAALPLPISGCDFFVEEASGLWGMDNE